MASVWKLKPQKRQTEASALISSAHAEQQPGGRPFPTQEMRHARDAVVASEEALQSAVREDLEQAERKEQHVRSFPWRRGSRA
jgi:hypothetical protein